ncbi:hypothetical protein GIB67_017771 [Kingdonia uniflora]|uniref:HTH myb-type domain-containing protein n=1 Tax=Kingdonia uniflora TaxID=39325 RepID=A0A7J7MNV9_9MAGN|nr:hypothetical protein GIB67_017771 [Kingdonia uniflora]
MKINTPCHLCASYFALEVPADVQVYESPSPIQVLLHQFFAVEYKGLLQSGDDFVWRVDSNFNGRFVIDVEFLDLKISSVNYEENQIAKSKKGQKRYSTEREDESEDNSEEHYTSKKKPRVSWSQLLHDKFLEAVKKLGTEAVPLKILKYMNVPGITRENVASHLQKFRSAIKKTDGDQSNMSSVSNGVNGYTSSTPLISFGGQGRNGLNFVNAFSGYPTPGMIPFTHHAQNPTTITNSFVNPNPLSISIYPCHGIINQQLPRFHEGLDQNYRSGSIPGIGDVASNSLRTRNNFHQSQLNGSKYQSFTQRSRFMDDYADSSSNVLGYNANNGANQSNSQLLDYIENPNIFGALPDFIGSQGPLFNNAISTNFSGGVLNDSVIGGQHNLFPGVQNSDAGHLMESADRDSSFLRSTSSSNDDHDELNAVWNQGTQCRNKSHESGMNFRR